MSWAGEYVERPVMVAPDQWMPRPATVSEQDRLERYLRVIDEERRCRPSEALLADEIHRLRRRLAERPSFDRALFQLRHPLFGLGLRVLLVMVVAAMSVMLAMASAAAVR